MSVFMNERKSQERMCLGGEDRTVRNAKDSSKQVTIAKMQIILIIIIIQL